MDRKTQLRIQSLNRIEPWQLKFILRDFQKDNYLDTLLRSEGYKIRKPSNKKLLDMIAYEYMTHLERCEYNMIDFD